MALGGVVALARKPGRDSAPMPKCTHVSHTVSKPQSDLGRPVAVAMAAALNCLAPLNDGDACGACASCRRLAAGVHPDFLVIGPAPDSQQIKIGQIREFRRLTAYPPFGDGWRVALIKPGEAMNDKAADALLKTLGVDDDDDSLAVVPFAVFYDLQYEVFLELLFVRCQREFS